MIAMVSHDAGLIPMTGTLSEGRHIQRMADMRRHVGDETATPLENILHGSQIQSRCSCLGYGRVATTIW